MASDRAVESKAFSAQVLKPIRQSYLQEAILRLIGWGREPERSPAREVKPSTPHPARHCLLVEDNDVNREFATRILERHGYHVVAVEDGRVALNAWSHEPFDVILMDIQMPVMDCFEATRAIREQEKATGRHVPIVAMTAHAMTGDREHACPAGWTATFPNRSSRTTCFANFPA